MAPGPKLPSDSPMGEDIKRIIREMLREELKINVEIKDQFLGDDETDITIKVGVYLGKTLITESESDFSVYDSGGRD